MAERDEARVAASGKSAASRRGAGRSQRPGALLGPRGGETTVTPGGLTRVSTYLDPEERSAVRQRAFEDERSISDVIRSAIRHYFKLK
jgi:hypothetical protein